MSEFVINGNITRALPSYFIVFLTILWFVGFMNAINWFDGVYGLASGISTI
ncbi:hypothetical protein KA478_04805 [Patescibacteria group bacterium]|nr:hypothetical protein [Patescibacteria group bacterium]